MFKKLYIVILTFIILSSFISEEIKSDSIILESMNRSFGPLNNTYESPKLFDIEMNKVLAHQTKLFTENCGQLENDEVRFYAQDGTVWFTDDGMWIEVREEISMTSRQSTVHSPESRLMTDDYRLMTNSYKRVILKQEFVGANLVRPMGRERLSWNSNFFYGNDSSKWRTDVPNYREVYYENLYDGIDLRYYSNEYGLKYDLMIHPGADVKQIRIRYEGAENLKIDKLGNLNIKTSIQNIKDIDLSMYQYYVGIRYPINGSFKIFNDLEYGFEILQDYNHQEDLIIDPLLYSTYVGGLGEDICSAITVDSNGSAFITGITDSSDFPTTPGIYDTEIYGFWDLFILKLNQSGSTLIYSTYMGGGGVESGGDITIDSNGNAFVTGITNSNDFPTSANAYDTIHRGAYDCIVVKLNHNGSKFIYSTFVGGYANDYGSGIEIDSVGNAYVTGTTDGDPFPYKRFPTTPGAFDESCNGFYEPFVFKLNSSGDSLLYSTFVGGGSSDWAYDIAIDSSGYVFVTGATYSSNFPITKGAFDTIHNENFDCFVFKLNLSGAGSSDLIYSTFVGGKNWDWANAIALNSIGETVVTGFTWSTDFPTTTEAYDKSYNGSSTGSDCFIFKLNNNGSELIFSTYLGGKNEEEGCDIAIDQIGDIYISGVTNSSDFPTTYDAFDNSWNNKDCFLSKLSQDGKWLIYSTFIGGSNDEALESGQSSSEICVSDVGIIYMTGITYSNDLSTTPNAFNRIYAGNSDVFVLKLSITPYFNFSSISLLDNNIPLTTAYARYQPYTFRIILNDTISTYHVETIKLVIDPLGADVQLVWNSSTGQFTELFDPYDSITVENSSNAYNIYPLWIIDFNVTFNWTYPNENLQRLQAYATSPILPTTWFNTTKNYHVENDLILIGNLTVHGEDNRLINDDKLVRAGETINWSGLKAVYENTIDIYPPANEFNINIWDSSFNLWSISTMPGFDFYLTTIAASKTNLQGDKHIINLTGIPPECDASNISFVLRIDGDNVTFSNLKPDNRTWYTDTTVDVGINISDYGGGLVDGTKVMYSVSIDNGTTWSDWITTPSVTPAKTINVITATDFEEGTNNLIKWCASDTVGNGPTESETYRVRVDTVEILFSSPWPLMINRSSLGNVDVGITISDNTSEVNAETIEYSISENGGKTWGPWTSVKGYENGMKVNVKINLTLHNHTENRIRWRACDIAGNGPTRSEAHIINVIKPAPKVKLISPTNGSVINTTIVTLEWALEDEDVEGIITYKILFGPSAPPTNVYLPGDSQTSLEFERLVDNTTYYWQVVIIINNIKRYPGDEIWWFKTKFEPVIEEKIFEIEINGIEFLSLFQGENNSIELSITNHGNTEDNIQLDILDGKLSAYIRLDNNSTLILGSKKKGSRILIIELPKIILPGNYSINILAISLNSGGQVKNNHIINVEIKELIISEINDSKPETGEKPNYIDWYLIVLIFIIILIIIFAIIVKRKKQKIEKESLDKEPIAIKPGELPTQEAGTVEQLKVEPLNQVPQLESINIVKQMPTSPVPQLVKSTQIEQKSYGSTMETQVVQLPLLPPLQNDISHTNEESTEELRSVPVQQQDETQIIQQNNQKE